jgi:hypothetical protein
MPIVSISDSNKKGISYHHERVMKRMGSNGKHGGVTQKMNELLPMRSRTSLRFYVVICPSRAVSTVSNINPVISK